MLQRLCFGPTLRNTGVPGWKPDIARGLPRARTEPTITVGRVDRLIGPIKVHIMFAGGLSNLLENRRPLQVCDRCSWSRRNTTFQAGRSVHNRERFRGSTIQAGVPRAQTPRCPIVPCPLNNGGIHRRSSARHHRSIPRAEPGQTHSE